MNTVPAWLALLLVLLAVADAAYARWRLKGWKASAHDWQFRANWWARQAERGTQAPPPQTTTRNPNYGLWQIITTKRQGDQDGRPNSHRAGR